MIHPNRKKYETIFLPSDLKRAVLFGDGMKIEDDEINGVAYVIKKIDYRNIENARKKSIKN